MHRCKQTQIPRPAKLEEEAEAEVEELRDVEEVMEKPETACSTQISECSRNLPGRDRGAPKTASAAENPESSLEEDRRPSITRGR